MSSWEEARLGDEIELAYGKSLPVHKRETGPFRVFGSNGCVGHHSAALVLKPGIIVGRKGSVGSVVWSEHDFWPIDTTYYVVNKKGHNWRFLFHLLSSIGLSDMNSHSAVPGLNRENVYSIKVRLPKKNEQESIASVLDIVENAIDLHRKKLAVLNDLFKALLYKLMMEKIQVSDLNLSAIAEAGDTGTKEGLSWKP